MIFTSIFKFRKPEGTDPVDIADVNANMDIIEMELNKRPEKTGAASEMTAVFSEGKEVKALEPGETLGTSLGKIAKLVTDYISFKKEVGDGSGAVSEALGGLKFGQDANGNWGYILPDTTEVIPFGRGESDWNGEIENADWEKVPSGTYSNFTKAIYQNGYLAAITANGMIVYTLNGEDWNKSELEYQDCRLMDIDWDGERFLVTGSYTDGAGKIIGLILTTDDFLEYQRISIENSNDSETEYDVEYSAVHPVNGSYIVVAIRRQLRHDNSYLYAKDSAFLYSGDLINTWKEIKTLNIDGQKGGSSSSYVPAAEKVLISSNSAKCSQGMYWSSCDNSGYARVTSILNNCTFSSMHSNNGVTSLLPNPVFECKDTLYWSYRGGLYRISGIYFNDEELYINGHSMVVVKKGEIYADKTSEDWVEIAPEDTMACIVKAFGRPYIFGNRGLIMRPV